MKQSRSIVFLYVFVIIGVIFGLTLFSSCYSEHRERGFSVMATLGACSG